MPPVPVAPQTPDQFFPRILKEPVEPRPSITFREVRAPKRPEPVEPEPEPLVETEAVAPRWPRRNLVAAAVLALAVVGGGVFAGRSYFVAAPTATASTTGTLVITTNPSGASAYVDSQPRGLTPLRLTLPAGDHLVEIRGNGEPRTFPVTIAAGSEVSQYIELPKAGPATGQLQVRSTPPGARVVVDGVTQGTAPTLISNLTPGEHVVVLEGDLGAVKQTVMIEAGLTLSLVVPMSTPEGTPVSGWLAVSAPVELQFFENGRLLGSTQSDRILVTAGRHEIEMVNDAIGYRATRTVQIAPGRVATVRVEMPQGRLALNASPWAEVWINGERAGETPIGNLPIAIGMHDVVFRHPELGEQRHRVTVTASDVARLSVDMRKQ
jgi:hypothetical protein